MQKLFIYASLAIGLYIGSAIADWQTEKWEPVATTYPLGGGPATGPETESGLMYQEIRGVLFGDKNNNRYLFTHNRVDIITAAGRRQHLAGTGDFGYKDGPAEKAMFRWAIGGFHDDINAGCAFDGSAIFIQDKGNNVIRRIYKDKGRWMVDTWCGGGTTRLSSLAEGQSISPKQVVGSVSAMAVNRQGEVICAMNESDRFYRIAADGSTITYLGTLSLPGSKGTAYMRACADTVGNVYFESLWWNVVIRVDKDGNREWIAGDGVGGYLDAAPPLSASFNTIRYSAAAPGGDAIYLDGGDEIIIRRVPTDLKTTTSGLCQDGFFRNATGMSRNSMNGDYYYSGGGSNAGYQGGSLWGCDHEGDIYHIPMQWTRMSINIIGKGLVPSRLIRLRRVK